MVDHAAARLNMVESQLRTNRVSNAALLKAFAEIPRELFLPAAMRSFAYVDEDLRIADGRHLMQPMVLGRLLEAARPDAGDIVLDVGCGTGYATALLARLCATAVGLESHEPLATEATRILNQQGIDNAVIVRAPLGEGCPDQGPYNIILINGTVSEVPDPLKAQLTEGGRLVTVINDSDGMGRATLMQRHGDTVSGRVVFDASVPVLADFLLEPGFVF